jgi:DNA-binding NarL/FixJ family response regulator
MRYSGITGVSKTYTGATLSPQTERTKMYAREQLQIGRSRARVMVAYSHLARVDCNRVCQKRNYSIEELVAADNSHRNLIVPYWGGSLGMLRILIADDHELARDGIRSLLEDHAGWEVCAEARDGREAVSFAGTLRPDICLLDIGMPNLNGLDAARQILAMIPEARILILTVHDSEQMVREVLATGARGFLLKSDAGRDLVAAVEALEQRQTFFTSKVAQMMVDGYLRPTSDLTSTTNGQYVLTPREREVIQLVAEGKTTKEIATALGLSVKTAETHRTNLMRKLDLHSVADLTLYAVRNGIVHIY